MAAAALQLLCLLSVLAACGTASPAQAAPVPSTHHRRLQGAQWHGPHGWRGPGLGAETQLAASNAAIVNTQLAIEAAADADADPGMTQAATWTGSTTAYAATQARRPWGPRWGARRLMSGSRKLLGAARHIGSHGGEADPTGAAASASMSATADAIEQAANGEADAGLTSRAAWAGTVNAYAAGEAVRGGHGDWVGRW